MVASARRLEKSIIKQIKHIDSYWTFFPVPREMYVCCRACAQRRLCQQSRGMALSEIHGVEKQCPNHDKLGERREPNKPFQNTLHVYPLKCAPHKCTVTFLYKAWECSIFHQADPHVSLYLSCSRSLPWLYLSQINHYESKICSQVLSVFDISPGDRIHFVYFVWAAATSSYVLILTPTQQLPAPIRWSKCWETLEWKSTPSETYKAVTQWRH